MQQNLKRTPRKEIYITATGQQAVNLRYRKGFVEIIIKDSKGHVTKRYYNEVILPPKPIKLETAKPVKKKKRKRK
jgi:hypothetical protein